jgi:hypothetical protein
VRDDQQLDEVERRAGGDEQVGPGRTGRPPHSYVRATHRRARETPGVGQRVERAVVEDVVSGEGALVGRSSISNTPRSSRARDATDRQWSGVGALRPRRLT